jgi:hypothetical protein
MIFLEYINQYLGLRFFAHAGLLVNLRLMFSQTNSRNQRRVLPYLYRGSSMDETKRSKERQTKETKAKRLAMFYS